MIVISTLHGIVQLLSDIHLHNVDDESVSVSLTHSQYNVTHELIVSVFYGLHLACNLAMFEVILERKQ